MHKISNLKFKQCFENVGNDPFSLTLLLSIFELLGAWISCLTLLVPLPPATIIRSIITIQSSKWCSCRAICTNTIQICDMCTFVCPKVHAQVSTIHLPSQQHQWQPCHAATRCGCSSATESREEQMADRRSKIWVVNTRQDVPNNCYGHGVSIFYLQGRS